MQSYRIGLALADDSISPYRRADSAAALALEFESRLVSPRLVNAIPGRRGDQVHTAYTRVHGDLGQRVNEKTRDLKRSNHSLDLLYRTSQTLHDAPISDQPLRLALADIQTQLAVGPTVLCLRDSDRSAHSSRIITPEPVAKLDLCWDQGCRTCERPDRVTRFTLRQLSGEWITMISFPVRDRDQGFGILRIQLPADGTLEPWQELLLQRRHHQCLSSAQRATDQSRPPCRCGKRPSDSESNQ